MTDVTCHLAHARIRRRPRKKSVEQNNLLDRFLTSRGTDQLAFFQKLLTELRTKKSTSTGDDDIHRGTTLLSEESGHVDYEGTIAMAKARAVDWNSLP